MIRHQQAEPAMPCQFLMVMLDGIKNRVPNVRLAELVVTAQLAHDGDEEPASVSNPLRNGMWEAVSHGQNHRHRATLEGTLENASGKLNLGFFYVRRPVRDDGFYLAAKFEVGRGLRTAPLGKSDLLSGRLGQPSLPTEILRPAGPCGRPPAGPTWVQKKAALSGGLNQNTLFLLFATAEEQQRSGTEATESQCSGFGNHENQVTIPASGLHWCRYAWRDSDCRCRSGIRWIGRQQHHRPQQRRSWHNCPSSLLLQIHRSRQRL